MDSLIKLTNPSFQIEFDNKIYDVKKATLEQIVKYTIRLKENAGSTDIEVYSRMVAYGVYLLLHEVDPSLTEEFIYKNLPAVDPLDLLSRLGFIKLPETGKTVAPEELIPTSQ